MLYKVATANNVRTSPQSKQAHAVTTQNAIRTEFVNMSGVPAEIPDGIGEYWTSYMDSRVRNTAAIKQDNPPNRPSETRVPPHFSNAFGYLIV